jgi:hypothetical protein
MYRHIDTDHHAGTRPSMRRDIDRVRCTLADLRACIALAGSTMAGLDLYCAAPGVAGYGARPELARALVAHAAALGIDLARL